MNRRRFIQAGALTPSFAALSAAAPMLSLSTGAAMAAEEESKSREFQLGRTFFEASNGDQAFAFQTPWLEFQMIRVLSASEIGGACYGDIQQFVRKAASGLDGAMKTNPPDFETFINNWVGGWLAIAERYETIANRLAKSGDKVSTRTAYLRTANYFRGADMFSPPESDVQRMINTKAISAFKNMLDLSDAPAESVEIPYEGKYLPGYFIRPAQDKKRRKTLLLMTGYDGSSEELYFLLGKDALERGYNVLIFAGPGHREAIHLHPEMVFRHDYEVPVGAVFDYAATRADVDAKKIVFCGMSFGGALATRVAAFEDRLAAVTAYPGWTDFGAFVGTMRDPEAPLDPHSRSVMGVATAQEYTEKLATFKTDAFIAQTKPAVLTMVSEGEGEMTVAQSRAYYEALKGEKAFHLFTMDEAAAAHCSLNNNAARNAVMFSWLKEIL